MIIKWSEVQQLPNDIGDSDGRRCDCGKVMPHEYLEIYGITYEKGNPVSRLLHVKRVQSSGQTVRVFVDA